MAAQLHGVGRRAAEELAKSAASWARSRGAEPPSRRPRAWRRGRWGALRTRTHSRCRPAPGLQVFKDARAPRPMRSNAAAQPPLQPHALAAAPTARRRRRVSGMEVRLALVHDRRGPALNGVRKDFGEARPAAEPACPRPERPPRPGAQRLRPDLRCAWASTCLWSWACCLRTTSRTPCLGRLLPDGGPGRPAAPGRRGPLPYPSRSRRTPGAQRPSFGRTRRWGGLLAGPAAGMLPSPLAGPDDGPPSPRYLRCRPTRAKDLRRACWPDAHAADSVRCHLNFDPTSAPGVARVYDCRAAALAVTSLDGAQEAGQAGLVLGAHHALGGGGQAGQRARRLLPGAGQLGRPLPAQPELPAARQDPAHPDRAL